MGPPSEHAVIVKLRLRETGAVEPGDWEIVDRVGEALARVVARKRLGEYDGDEIGEGGATLYLYGPDADRLFAAVEPVLRGVPAAPGSHVVKRYGPPGDLEAPEVVVPLVGEPPPPSDRPIPRPYEVGDWFLCPLGDGTWVPGVVVGHDGAGTVLASFVPRRVADPATVDPASLRDLTGEGAFTHLRCFDDQIRRGGWPVLGGREWWDPSAWPTVEFERRVERLGRRPLLFAVVYDGGADRVVEERPIDRSEAGRRPPDVVSGSGAAVVHLRRRLEAWEAGRR